MPRGTQVDADFWIHQYKLLEGIDDPRFRIVAMYELIESAAIAVSSMASVIMVTGWD